MQQASQAFASDAEGGDAAASWHVQAQQDA